MDNATYMKVKFTSISLLLAIALTSTVVASQRAKGKCQSRLDAATSGTAAAIEAIPFENVYRDKKIEVLLESKKHAELKAVECFRLAGMRAHNSKYGRNNKNRNMK